MSTKAKLVFALLLVAVTGCSFSGRSRHTVVEVDVHHHRR
jgi:hypothetical protein